MCKGREGPQNVIWKPPPQDCLALLPPSVPLRRLCVHPIPCLNVDSPGLPAPPTHTPLAAPTPKPPWSPMPMLGIQHLTLLSVHLFL